MNSIQDMFLIFDAYPPDRLPNALPPSCNPRVTNSLVMLRIDNLKISYPITNYK
jgi:hypothetical protein